MSEIIGKNRDDVRPYGLRNIDGRKPRNRPLHPSIEAMGTGQSNLPARNVPRWHGPEPLPLASAYANDAPAWHILIPVVESDYIENKIIVDEKFAPFIWRGAEDMFRIALGNAKQAQSVFMVEAADILNEWISRQYGGHNPETDSRKLARYFRANPRKRERSRNEGNGASARYRESQLRLRAQKRAIEEIALVHQFKRSTIGRDDATSIFQCAALLSRRARQGVRIRVAQKTRNSHKRMLISMGYSGEILRETCRERRETVRAFQQKRFENLDFEARTEERNEIAEIFSAVSPTIAANLTTKQREVFQALQDGKSTEELRQIDTQYKRTIEAMREKIVALMAQHENAADELIGERLTKMGAKS